MKTTYEARTETNQTNQRQSLFCGDVGSLAKVTSTAELPNSPRSPRNKDCLLGFFLLCEKVSMTSSRAKLYSRECCENAVASQTGFSGVIIALADTAFHPWARPKLAKVK